MGQQGRNRHLSERQKQLLRLVVQEYIRTGRPVGSAALVRRYRLPYSPATVRNEFAVLTRMGFLEQPHTSAGRVPTPKAYRFLVGETARTAAAPLHLQEVVRQRIHPGSHAQDWLAQAATILAEHMHTAAWVLPPRVEKARCAGVRLYPWNGRRVLLVLALQGGWLRQRLVPLNQRVPQETLRQWQLRLNRLCQGRTPAELAMLPPPQETDLRTLWEVLMDELDRARRLVEAQVYHSGLQYVLRTEAAEPAIRLLEEPPRLEGMVRRLDDRLPVGEVEVFIGGEDDTPQEMAGCAVIVGRYGGQSPATGYLGIVGPLRLPYTQAVPAVRFLSRWLTQMFRQ